jgi:hypothetical protein
MKSFTYISYHRTHTLPLKETRLCGRRLVQLHDEILPASDETEKQADEYLPVKVGVRWQLVPDMVDEVGEEVAVSWLRKHCAGRRARVRRGATSTLQPSFT